MTVIRPLPNSMTATPSIWNRFSAVASSGTADWAPGGLKNSVPPISSLWGAVLTAVYAMTTGHEVASLAKVVLLGGIVACVIGLKLLE